MFHTAAVLRQIKVLRNQESGHRRCIRRPCVDLLHTGDRRHIQLYAAGQQHRPQRGDGHVDPRQSGSSRDVGLEAGFHELDMVYQFDLVAGRRVVDHLRQAWDRRCATRSGRQGFLHLHILYLASLCPYTRLHMHASIEIVASQGVCWRQLHCPHAQLHRDCGAQQPHGSRYYHTTNATSVQGQSALVAEDRSDRLVLAGFFRHRGNHHDCEARTESRTGRGSTPRSALPADGGRQHDGDLLVPGEHRCSGQLCSERSLLPCNLRCRDGLNGLRYRWVDRVCVLQGCRSQDDKPDRGLSREQ